ncbi:hypothetical protein MSPP1_003365 [Malassezia sp. CBS 17886]|nr:hypothetical protein MSPP1_003365 [Malassezia sp. CBS 17886]
MPPPALESLPEHPEVLVSAFSDDEDEDELAQHDVDGWVDDVHRLLGGTARRSAKASTAPPHRTPPAPRRTPSDGAGGASTPRPSPRAPAHLSPSPRTPVQPGTPPRTPAHASASPRAPAPRVPSLSAACAGKKLPLRPPVPTVALPARPVPTDIPEDLSSVESDAGCAPFERRGVPSVPHKRAIPCVHPAAPPLFYTDTLPSPPKETLTCRAPPLAAQFPTYLRSSSVHSLACFVRGQSVSVPNPS